MTTLKNDADVRLAVLTFRLAAQLYALSIAEIVEVAAMVEVISVPGAPRGVLGFANRHGAALLMLDLRQIFELPTVPTDSGTLFIVTQQTNRLVGLVVDEVLQVKVVQLSSLRPVPSVRKYIQGILQEDDQLLQLVALDSLLAVYYPSFDE